jgi:large repetitive protein
VPGSLALLDIVTPYVVGGAAIGEPLHELISALFVQDVETSFDDAGVVVSGMARFSADLTANPPRFTPPASISFGGTVNVDHRTARHEGAWWDFPDIAIRFRLSTPRASSPAVDTVTGGPGGTPAPRTSNTAASTVLPRLGQGVPAAGQPAQDAPSTVFHLDLLIDAATLHLPFLTGAKLDPNGMLEADPAHAEVTVTLPKIKLSFEQTAGTASTDPQLTIALDSWAALDIDDPAGTAYAELIRMSPPYALIGPGTALGFGFQSLILDLSGTETPPELLSKFGVGDDFRGLYLPDVRVFVRPPGLDGLGIDVSARELLIGIGPEGGVSGIFGLDVVMPDAPQNVVVSIYDEYGQFLQRFEFPDGVNPYNHEPIDVPAKTQWVVDVHGGQPPYNINVDGQVQTNQPINVTFPAGQQTKTVAIAVADVHAGGQSRTGNVPIRLTAQSLTAGQTQQGGPQPASLAVTTNAGPGYTITMEDSLADESVTLVFTPPDPTTATAGGSPLTVSGGRATVPLADGAAIDVAASWNVPATPPATPVTVLAQFQFAQPAETPNQVPDENDPAWAAFAAVDSNIRTVPSNDESSPDGGWTADDHFLVGSSDFLTFKAGAQANPAGHITLEGKASKEHAPNLAYNVALSQRRVWAMQAFLRANGITNPVDGSALGEQPPPAGTGYLQPGRGAYRVVVCTVQTGGSPAATKNGAVHITRPARPPLPVPQPPAVVQRQPAGNDDFRFKELHVRVEIDHNRLIAVEIKLKIDVQTVLESKLAKVNTTNPGQGQPAGAPSLPVGKRADPNDGVLDMRVQLTLDDTVDRWQVVASLFEQDADGFLQTPAPSAAGEGSDAEQYWRTFFGILIALAPLTDALGASNTAAGDVVALVVSVAVPFAATSLHVVHVPRITLYGGELTVTHDNSGTRGVLLLDVEVALVVTLELGAAKLIDTDPKNPITVRYKAVGFGTSDRPQARDLLPVFDSSKGYTINIPSTGGIKVPDPLGDILQVAGTRIARSNPVNLELDLVLKTDLGVVSVDKTTIRIPLEGGHVPTISALGVHINVPGALDGHGYLAIYSDGFAGQLDVSLPSVGIRVAAGLAVRHVAEPAPGTRTATAVLVTLEVDFPVPIALGSSGLGIYGFGGLFAVHYERDEHPGDPVPALNWLERVNGDPLDISGWKPEIDHWAIGLEALLGTMDAGFTLNVKGMLIFELPGPRILLVMKANLIQPKPERKGNVTATILAIIDLDLGRQRITIGLTFDYGVVPLLKIHVPVRAIFPFNDLAHFAIDAGSWYAPATVEFFQLFTARGYFMIRGKGIPDTSAAADNYDVGQVNFPLAPSQLTGFSIMTGVSVSFLWGSRSSGLYLSVGASIDVGIGFEPIMFEGHLKLWGELHLWIIGIEADAELKVAAGQKGNDNIVLIDGEVHGRIDLFFFSIEGSVHVTLGDSPDSPPAPPPLVTGVSLQSRAAALLTGVSSDRPIDGKLSDAHSDGPAPQAEAVPIDSIVVIHLDCTPRINGGAAVTTTNPSGAVTVPIATPDGPPAPVVRRGQDFYIYRITGITLDHGVTAGEVPIVWWPNEPHPTSETKRELALLTRVPDPHPSAVERSKHLDDLLSQTWDTVCAQIAPATSVLWTFHDTPLGPSTVGWVLAGTAWPDPPGSTRSVAPDLRLDVAETWRTGDPAVDLSVDIAPARVIGGPVECDERCAPRIPIRPPAVPGRELLTIAAARNAAANAELSRLAARTCWAHVLEAPFLRHQDLHLLASHPLGEILIKLAEQAAAQRKDPLDDVLAVKTGPIVRFRALLAVPDLLLRSRACTVRLFADDGTVLGEFPVDGSGPSRLIGAETDLPPSWIDPGGPWFCRVEEVLRYLQDGADRQRLHLVLVDTGVPARTAYVQFGVRDVQRLTEAGLARPSYLLGVVETLAAAEVAREQHDTTVKDSKITVVDGALADPASQPALLLPNTDYTVGVTWEWTTCDEHGTIPSTAAWTAGQPQNFHFRTDDAPLAPRTVQVADTPAQVMPVRLDPWVLLTDPFDGDPFFFYGDKLRVVFTVDYLLHMFDTYGVDIQAKVRAASFKDADPASPNFAKTVQALGPAAAAPLKGANVFTPWEDTIRGIVAGLPCIDSSGDVSRHQILDMDLLLEPRTDYIFDIELVNPPVPAPDTTVSPLFRRPFTTSRYKNWQEMAVEVSAANLVEAPAGDTSQLEALTSKPGTVPAAALDAALRLAGLRPVVEVTNPVVELLWATVGGTLQPRILVIRTPEPLVRTRKEPDQYEPPGVPRLQRKVITLQDTPYLEVIATEGVAGAAPLHIASQPGMNTVVVVVDSGRGAPIDLTLRRHGNKFLGENAVTEDTPLFAVTMDAATWEVV